MKKSILYFLFVLMCAIVKAQVPQGFTYQAFAGDASGNSLKNLDLQVKVSILSDTVLPVTVWEELHPAIRTNVQGIFSLIVGSGVRQPASSVVAFKEIDWSSALFFIKIQVLYQGVWKNMGSAKLWTVPYAMVAGNLTGTLDKLDVKGVTTSPDSALFEVKNKTGQTVFAVYNEGVRVYVNDGVKGAKGGFAIGGFSTSKAPSQEYFVVNADSIRAYIYDNPLVKKPKGGFAIGGFNNAKGLTNDYLLISPDSARVYINNAPSTKGAKGGFAIGGFNNTKGTTQNLMAVSDDSIRLYINDSSTKSAKGGFAIGGFDLSKGQRASFLNVATDNSGKIDPSDNRILWYPAKNAFLTGKVLIQHPDSVGENSFASGFESRAKGNWSQALGYQATARGNYSTSIGRNSVANSPSSFAFGNSAQALNESSFAFGSGAKAIGINSYAFGSIGIDTLGNLTGQKTVASGKNSIAIGMGSQSTNLGAFSFGIGNIASGEFSLTLGYESSSPADYGIAIGKRSTAMESFSIAIGDSSLVTGNSSVAIGKRVKALGRSCLTLGNYSQSAGYSSIAIGSYANSNSWSISLGNFTSATGMWSTAIGYKTNATALYSNAFGRESVASGENSFAFGHLSKASGNYSYSFGFNSESSNTNAFALGYIARATGLSSYSIGWYTLASGNYSTAMGSQSVASGFGSFAMGSQSVAAGEYSVATGYSTDALGDYSVAMGYNSQASGYNATALGSNTNSDGAVSTSLGSNTHASGFNSVSMGLNSTSQSFCSLVLGRYNSISGSVWEWLATDPLFVIGNGTSATAPSDAFSVLKNGNVGIGVSSPLTKLDIAGGNNWDLAGGEGDLRIGNSQYRLKVGVALAGGGAGSVGIMQYGQPGGYNVLALGAQGNNLLFINGSSQNVGIGTNTPGYKLTVNGSAWCSSGAWTGSDIRWKKNISLFNNALSGILSLQVVNYDLRTSEFPEMGFESSSQIGLIAQEVEKIFPLLVKTDNDGYKAVAYDKLSAVLVQGMKEQQIQIESVVQENLKLKAEIDELKALVNSLIPNNSEQMNK